MPLSLRLPLPARAAGTGWVTVAALLVLVMASPARASAQRVHLLPTEAAFAATPPSTAVPAAAVTVGPSLGWSMLGAGAAAAVVAAPGSVLLGSWMGGLTPNLFAGALPPLLLAAVLPPLAVTLAEVLVGNALSPGHASFFPAFWAGLGTQVLALTTSILLGATVGSLVHMALFTLAEAVLLPSVVTLVVEASAPRIAPAAPPVLAPVARGPELPGMLTVPAVTARF